MEIGTLVKEFIATENNKRNSEGSFVRMPSGRIVFAYSYFIGSSWMDHANAAIAIVYSDDDGKTFSEPEIILRREDCNADNLMSVSLVPMLDNSVGVFYGKKLDTDTDFMKSIICMRRTFDFKTFSEEVECTNEKVYFTLNNDRVCRLKNGNLILPLSRYDEEAVKKGYIGEAVFFISEDDGRTWKRSETVKMHSRHTKTGLQEPGVVELDDGTIFAYFRTDLSRQYESRSFDGGYTWTPVEPSIFTSPISPMSIKTLKDGRNLAVFNPEPNYFGVKDGRSGGRAPLVAWLLDGQMNPASPLKYLEESKEYGYCYTAIYELEDAILLAYCSGFHKWPEESVLGKMSIRRIEKSELR